MQVIEQLGPDRVRPLRRVEYDRLVALGFFADERLELLRGVLVATSRQGALHAEVVRRLGRLFTKALDDRAMVRVQSPLAVADDSEPEPDVAVVPPGDYTEDHPGGALLVVEVADSSLAKDRSIKANLYAAAGIPEYWLVDLEDRVIEIHRGGTGGRYAAVTRHGRGDVVRPAAFPDVDVRVGEILPAPKP